MNNINFQGYFLNALINKVLLYFFSPRPFICICLSLWNNKLYLNDWMSISFVIWEQSPGLLSVWPLNNSLSSAEHILFALQRARAKILSFPSAMISPLTLIGQFLICLTSHWFTLTHGWPHCSWFLIPGSWRSWPFILGSEVRTRDGNFPPEPRLTSAQTLSNGALGWINYYKLQALKKYYYHRSCNNKGHTKVIEYLLR